MYYVISVRIHFHYIHDNIIGIVKIIIIIVFIWKLQYGENGWESENNFRKR